MLATRHGIYAAQVHQSGGSATNLGGITSEQLNLQTNVSQQTTDGNVAPVHVNLLSAMPGGRLGVVDIGTWLAAVGQRSVAIAGGTNPGLVLFGQKHLQGSTRAGSGVHSSYTMKNGTLYSMSLSCEHQADAELQLGIMPIWDGTNLPIVANHAASLPTGASDVARYGLGPLVIDGDTFVGQRSLSIDFGNRVEADSSDGDIFPTACSVLEAAPVVTIGGVNPAWFGESSIPLTGLCVGHAATSIFLRKRSRCTADGFSEADDHIQITVCGLVTLETIADGSGTGRLTTAAKIHTAFDGTNLPLVFDLAAALPS